MSAPPAPLAITGGSGWIGSWLHAVATARGIPCQLLDRAGLADPADAFRIKPGTVVVHLAAIAHRAKGTVPPAQYLHVNRDLTVRLGQHAARSGAARFVFVSTAAVMGPVSPRPWRESDRPDPRDAYAQSKLEAERALWRLHEPGRFDVVVCRPPLVWGPGVRANFLQLLRLAATDWPLPLGRATAPRSMIYVSDLAEALLHAARSPAVGAGVYFVADQTDRSVADWVREIRRQLNRPARLLPVPRRLCGWAARAAGRGGLYDRLFEPLQVDASRLRATGWSAASDFRQALAQTLGWLAAQPRDAVPARSPGH